MNKTINLYRRFNPDGSPWKDWAFADEDGKFVVYFGKTGTRMQSRIIGQADMQTITKSVGEKEKEGYLSQGATTLNASNFVVEPQAPKAQSSELYVFQSSDPTLGKDLYMQHAKEVQAPDGMNDNVIVGLTQAKSVIVTIMRPATLEQQLFVFGWVTKCISKGLTVNSLFSSDSITFANKLQVVEHLQKRHTGVNLAQLLVHYHIKEESVTDKIRQATIGNLVF